MHWIWSLVAAMTAQRVRVNQRGSEKAIHLTFDDGPHPDNTPKLLDVLAQNSAKATFFLLGQNAQAHPDLVRRILQEGHVIANHSMTHPNFRTLSPHQQLAEIDLADSVLATFDGQTRHAFRPPRGNATVTTILSAMLRAQPLVLWTFDSFDFKLPLPELISRLNTYQPKQGDILLFHDDMGTTVEALREVLPHWRHAGFSLTPA